MQPTPDQSPGRPRATASAAPRIADLRTVLMVFAAMFCIVGGDAAGTGLTTAGFPPTFVAWARFALAAVVLAPFCGVRLAEVPRMADWRLVLRVAPITLAIVCILMALRTEPMANVFGGFFVGPIVSYLLSAVLLGERIAVVRTVLLAVSFAGVLIVVRPGFGMTSGMALAMLAGALHGCYLVATRWLAPGYRPRFLLLSQLVIGALILSPFALAPLPPLGGAAVVLLLVSALGSAVGNLLLVLVNRVTPAGVVAPLIYSQLLAAVLIGLVVLGQWPDLLTPAGLCIIAAAGVSSVWFAGRGR